ncbi:MAG: glycoside hydrolase family 3 protein, partial [Limisphaerales bacterium]
DARQRPLTLTFTAVKNRAKFNTLQILDASGNALVSLNASDLADPLDAAANKAPDVSGPVIWKDPSKPLDERIQDLISRMSLAEKVAQIRNTTPAIPRLGIPAYDFWSEALHGVAFSGAATVFPQAIGAAATWDTPLIHREADVISTEARAKFNDYTSHHHGNSKRFYGLTFWSPNVNIFRDPRWGRGQETYGEDPFLTGSFAVAFIRGLQGNDPKYVKAMACAKHYDVHSGPEPLRHEFNATPPERDLYETYLPQFEMAVRQGRVGGIMGAYSALDGVPDCANYFLLTDILRKQWGFDGYIVSDCDAIHDIYSGHHYADSLSAAAADAVKAGCDICCGGSYNALLKAVQEKLITEPEIDHALYYALKTRFRLGLFDPPGDVPWSKIGMDQNDTPQHEALALKVAEESMVLLKNNGLLPLDRHRIRRIAVIGENADSVPVLVGNYNGTPARPVTILDGIK